MIMRGFRGFFPQVHSGKKKKKKKKGRDQALLYDKIIGLATFSLSTDNIKVKCFKRKNRILFLKSVCLDPKKQKCKFFSGLLFLVE